MHPENYRGRLDVTSRLPAFLMLSPEAGSFTKAKESTLLLYMKESPCLRCSLESRRFFTRLSSAVLSVCYMSPAITTSDRELSALSRLILTQIKDMTKWSLKYTFRGEVPGKNPGARIFIPAVLRMVRKIIWQSRIASAGSVAAPAVLFERISQK